jgi:hypothetical protein
VVDHQTDASIDAARALEYASREAALVSGAAAAHGQMSIAERELFANAVADQRLLIGDALGPDGWPASSGLSDGGAG